MTPYCRCTSAPIIEGATKSPIPCWPKTFSKALSSNSATIAGLILSKLVTKALPPLLLVVMASVGGLVLAAVLLPMLEIQSLVQ